jgi:hypothetical protein
MVKSQPNENLPSPQSGKQSTKGEQKARFSHRAGSLSRHPFDFFSRCLGGKQIRAISKSYYLKE